MAQLFMRHAECTVRQRVLNMEYKRNANGTAQINIKFMEVSDMAKKENRFEVVYKDGAQLKDDGVRQIIVDTETGVNYLVWKSGYAGGITPLLDSEGKVIVTETKR